MRIIKDKVTVKYFSYNLKKCVNYPSSIAFVVKRKSGNIWIPELEGEYELIVDEGTVFLIYFVEIFIGRIKSAKIMIETSQTSNMIEINGFNNLGYFKTYGEIIQYEFDPILDINRFIKVYDKRGKMIEEVKILKRKIIKEVNR